MRRVLRSRDGSRLMEVTGRKALALAASGGLGDRLYGCVVARNSRPGGIVGALCNSFSDSTGNIEF